MTTVPSNPQSPAGIPADLLREIEAKAAAMRLSVASYLRFLMRVRERGHDKTFIEAARGAFAKNPDALRKLAQ